VVRPDESECAACHDKVLVRLVRCPGNSDKQRNVARVLSRGATFLQVTPPDRDKCRCSIKRQDRSGASDSIDASRAGQIAQAFRPPLRFAQVHTAGLYEDAGFCQDCDAPYCYQHWYVSETGYSYCPRGHGKSLDPHW
jgi:hypothetical protein